MYRAFYKLRENPFNVTSDPQFLFLSPAHQEALDHLRYGINERKGFLTITGEIGAGKTTLCRALINGLDERTRVALILNAVLPELQLLEAIVEDFGIVAARRTKVALIRAINSFLLEQLQQGNNAVLIIDDAQNLKPSSLETIRMLSNLETEKEKLLQIVLVGQPQLREKLELPELVQLKQRIAVRFHLRALNEREVGPYIRHRLAVAGSPGTIVFGEDAVGAIFRYSGGIPRLINIVADKALLHGFVKESFTIGETDIATCLKELKGEQLA